MNTFWQKLSGREQVLVSGAAGLFVLLALAFFVIRPLINYRSNSDMDLAAAKAEYRVIASLAATHDRAQAAPISTEQSRPNGQSSRILISTSARDKGLIVSRIQPAEDNSLTLWMDSVSSSAFYVWLRSLEIENGLTPNLVSLQKNGDGTLRAQVQFSGVQ